MGKWAKYSIYDGRGDLVITFKGKGIRKMKPAPPKKKMGFAPLVEAVATGTVDVKVECDCDEDHEDHLEN